MVKLSKYLLGSLSLALILDIEIFFLHSCENIADGLNWICTVLEKLTSSSSFLHFVLHESHLLELKTPVILTLPFPSNVTLITPFHIP
jgi:hypothetical protein